MSISSPEKRVTDYWTARAKSFAAVRKNELGDDISERWMREIDRYLPAGSLDILDVGTGTGYFAILLTRRGHRVTGIDLTPAMIEEALTAAARERVSPIFCRMDAQALTFPDESFDAIVTRNLTWTLPDPKRAYAEWFRVLRPGGVLINFDADYAQNVRNENQAASNTTSAGVYGHIGVTNEMRAENDAITLSMPAARHARPDWDRELCRALGFASCQADLTAGQRILRERDLSDAPLFLFTAKKPGGKCDERCAVL